MSRDEWVRIGMAAKAAGLEFEDFHDWSSPASNYAGQGETRDAWRSFKDGGGVNAGTLFHLARQAGWTDPANDNQRPEPKRPTTWNDPRKHWDSGAPAPANHGYIQRKGGTPEGLRLVTWPLRGWAKFKGQSLEGWLMVPARSADGALASIQFIGPAGEKLNAHGCSMAGTFTVGTLTQGALAYIVEGVGHAWSINAVTGGPAVVSFGSSNIERAAAAIKRAGAVPVIVPDRGKEESAWRSARRLDCTVAQLPEWMPDGDDINDLHQARGAQEVLAVLQGARLATAAGVELDRPLEHPEKLYHPDQIDWRRDKVTQEWVFHQAKGTAENLARLLRGYGVRIRYNELSRDVEISINGTLPTGDLARNVSLSVVEDLCRINGYPYTAAAGHLDRLASLDAYNPALEWVQSKPWDGRERIRSLFDCLQLADPDKAAISWTLFRKWVLGAVAILSGRTCKFEHVLVLVDPMGGLGKTRLFNTLCPPLFQADGVTLDPTNKDSVLEVVTKWLVELGEIGATFSKSDIENLKAFLSKPVDELRPAYARSSNRYQRRTAFFGSVNRVQFLVDDTNNRRFWPIHVCGVNYQHGIDMQQVWAEALARVNAGEVWHLTQDENRAIGEHNEEYRSKDRTEEMILSIYEPTSICSRWMSASQVLDEIGVSNAKAADTRKAGALLRKLFNCKTSRGVTVYHMPPSKNAYNGRPY